MTLAIQSTFYVSVALYVAAVCAALLHLPEANLGRLRLSAQLLCAGVLCQVLMLGMRGYAWGRLPLTTMTDSLNLLVMFSALVALFVAYRHRVPALLTFYLPPLAAISLVNAVASFGDVNAEPRVFESLPLAVHVGMAFLAYALFLTAATTGAAYLFLSAHLKKHHTTLLTKRLPSLEELDATLVRLVSYGYPLFILTLIQGAAWAWQDRELLGPYWWLSPKVVLSFVMALFYAIAFHARHAKRLHGPRLAQLVSFGFALLIALYIGLSLLNLRGYRFWGGTP